MGGSFVLKDASGRAVGYVMQGTDAVRCRVGSAQGELNIHLFFDDGSCEARVLEPQKEQRFDGTKRRLTGAAVSADTMLLADTGEAARAAFERERMQQQAAQRGQDHPVRRPQSAPPDRTEEARTAPREIRQTQTAYSLPQRRWPPPPCMPQAIYRNGRWE